MPLWSVVTLFVVFALGAVLLGFQTKKEITPVAIAGIVVFSVLALALLFYFLLPFLFTGPSSDAQLHNPSTTKTSQTTAMTASSEQTTNPPDTEPPTTDPSETEPPATEPPLPEDYDLPVELVPPLHPDVLHLRTIQFEEMPLLGSQNDISTYVLWNLLHETYTMEFYISRETLGEYWEGDGYMLLYQGMRNALTYYMFSAYYENDMLVEDRGGPGYYALIDILYYKPGKDLEARAEALEYVIKNPVPEGGFENAYEEMEYARKVHDFVAKKVTYSPMGYIPGLLSSLSKYDAMQEAYNVLAEEEHEAVCAGYARAFGLICHYAGINTAWVWGNYDGATSHAWNILYPGDGSEPVVVDVTWDDTASDDVPDQEEVEYIYFYIPVSEDYEHEVDSYYDEFLYYLNGR